MTRSRWQVVEELYHRAASLAVHDQRAFLDAECGSDEQLAAEVRTLLQHTDDQDGLLDTPAIELLARSLVINGERSALLLPDSTISHYRILGVLGRGGMGVVHKAQDLRLGRLVALKLLPEYLVGDQRARDRFEREAQAASALNHPKICTVYEIDQVDERRFMAIEFLDGHNLKERLAAGPVSADEALRIAVDVCDALEAAHTVGIVHRDIKPANIFLTSQRTTKVLDFGAAKRLGVQPVESMDNATDVPAALADDRHLTLPGTVLGTVAYMAPEHANGLSADARSDIYSLGAVLFEMVTGRLPGSADTEHNPSTAVDASQTAIGAAVVAIARKALQTHPDQRYQRIAELRADLLDIAQRLPRRQRRLRTVWMGGAVAALLTIAGAVVWQRTHMPAATQFAERAHEIRSLAVLPFRDLSGDASQAFFAQGITNALIADLTKVASLQVISSSSSQRYQGTRKSLVQVARELQVHALVEGTVARAGDHVRVTAQLVDGARQQKLWEAKYDRDARDVLQLQYELAQAVSTAIAGSLSPLDRARLAKGSQRVNPAAYEAYLKAAYFAGKGNDAGFAKAQQYYEKSIALDAGFAPAYAGLAEALAYQAYTSRLPPSAWITAEDLLGRSLQLDPDSVLAHTLVGMIRFQFHCDRPGAERELNRALRINPGDVDSLTYHSYFLLEVGRMDEAIAEKTRVLQSDPVSVSTSAELGMYYYRAGRYHEAVMQLERALELDPLFPYALNWLGMTYAAQHRYAEAVAELEKAVDAERAPRWLGNLGYVYALAGRTQEARAVAAELARTSTERYIPAYLPARIYAALGDRREALAWLARTRKGEHQLRNEPGFESLRADPEFIATVARLNAPDGCPAF